jgi:probable F420-dependent oxidoreductase
MPELQFAVNLGRVASAADVVAAAHRAEEAGMDAVTVADHLGAAAPFQLLAAAAAVTERVRLRTYVLDAYFWNPALLAREVATLDVLSGGRVELGVGAGHMKHEHDTAGLPFPPIRQRWAHVEEVVAEVRRHLAGPDHRPAPVQQPVPVMVAAMGATGLGVAARTADVVGLAGAVQVADRPPGTFTLATAEVVDERVAQVREQAQAAGRPEPVLDVLVQSVQLGRDPREAATELVAGAAAEGADWFDVEEVLRTPFFLFAASAQDAAEEVARRSERWGITSWSTHAPSAAAMTEVVAAYRSRPVA